MKYQLLIIFIFAFFMARGQELFVFTEPASNMAAKSVGIRLNNSFIKESGLSTITYRLAPEIMVGISRRIMLHADVFLADRNKDFSAQGGSLYAKYRFFSRDDVQQHFRMSAFGRYSFNNSAITQEEINLYGFNSGYEAGIIATQLLHKVALSSGLSFVKATDNGSNKLPFATADSRAINYTLSVGKLMLPREYKDYKQTNVNLMLELLSQYNMGSGKYYIDAAPSIQFIFNSVARVDIGYRQSLGSTLNRTTPNSVFIRLEYNFFNVY